MFGVAVENPPRQIDYNPTISQPFRNVEEAWFWFMVAYEAGQNGARIASGRATVPRPCEPVDIYRAVERLYRNRRLRWDHMKILAHYGKRRTVPDWGRAQEKRAHHLWQEAMRELDTALRRRGIVSSQWWSL